MSDPITVGSEQSSCRFLHFAAHVTEQSLFRTIAHTGLTQKLDDLKLSDDPVLQGCTEDDFLNIDYNIVLNNKAGDECSTDSNKNTPDFVERDYYPNMLQRRDSYNNSEGQDQYDILEKESNKTIENECETLRGNKFLVLNGKSGLPSEPPVFEEDFAEDLMDDKWVKVGVVKKEGSSMGKYQGVTN